MKLVLKNKNAWTAETAIDYVDTLKFMERFEFAEEVHLGPKRSDTGFFWFLLVQSAFANSTPQCLLAGRIGQLQKHTCKPSDESFKNDLAICQARHYSIPCSRGIFPGDPLTCANSNDSRWTAACASQFFSAAGLRGKTLDSDFDSNDLKTLSTYLNKKNVKPQDLATKTETVCKAIQSSNKRKDVLDCKELYNQLRSTSVTQTEEVETRTVITQITRANGTVTAPGCASCEIGHQDLPTCDLDQLTDGCQKLQTDLVYSDGTKTLAADQKPSDVVVKAQKKFRDNLRLLKDKEPALYEYLNSAPGRALLDTLVQNKMTPSEAVYRTTIELPVEENGVTVSRRLTFNEVAERIRSTNTANRLGKSSSPAGE